ncbi:exodeoxyribonuclease III, putative, partial [Hepatocystis sp. ex Piliocolobus tephrosceles]
LNIDILCLQETKTNYSVIENDFNLLEAYSDEYESYWSCFEKEKVEKWKKRIGGLNSSNNMSNRGGYSGLATYVSKHIPVLCASNNVFENFFFFISDDILYKYKLLIERTSSIDGSSVAFYVDVSTDICTYTNVDKGTSADKDTNVDKDKSADKDTNKEKEKDTNK